MEFVSSLGDVETIKESEGSVDAPLRDINHDNKRVVVPSIPTYHFVVVDVEGKETHVQATFNNEEVMDEFQPARDCNLMHYYQGERLNQHKDTWISRELLPHNEFLDRIVEEDFKTEVDLINQESLSFGRLFELKSELIAPRVLEHINLTKKIALNLIDEVVTEEKSQLQLGCKLCDYVQYVHNAINWILVSGAADDGMSNDYDNVLDIAAALLVKGYSDRTVLPNIVDLIFSRNRVGMFYNDLVWIFFESRCTDSLVLIANRLLSEHPKDVELAFLLLAFIPGISTYKNTNKQRPYKAFQQWIEENNRFLYYTGENYQQSTNPVPYKIAKGAKYLCKVVSVDTGIIIESLTSEDYILIDNFNTLKEEVRRELSNFSFKLHKEDIYYWNIWLRYPVNKQLEIAGLRGDIAFD